MTDVSRESLAAALQRWATAGTLPLWSEGQMDYGIAASAILADLEKQALPSPAPEPPPHNHDGGEHCFPASCPAWQERAAQPAPDPEGEAWAMLRLIGWQDADGRDGYQFANDLQKLAQDEYNRILLSKSEARESGGEP